jgi:fructokinase
VLTLTKYFAVIERCGTKFNCAIVDAQRQILAQQRIATTTPDKTLSEVIHFFKTQISRGVAFERLGLITMMQRFLNESLKVFRCLI